MSDSDQNQPSHPTPGDIAHGRVTELQVAQYRDDWVEREFERREKAKEGGENGNDQNELEKARILPVEERERGGRDR